MREGRGIHLLALRIRPQTPSGNRPLVCLNAGRTIDGDKAIMGCHCSRQRTGVRQAMIPRDPYCARITAMPLMGIISTSA